MLKIRSEQLRVFQPVAEAAFSRAVSQFVQKAHGDEMISLPNIESALSELPQDVVREMVNGGIAKAREFGLEAKSDLVQFVTTQILAAPNFFEHPIAQKVLGEIAQKAAGGFQQLMDEMTDKAWKEVAENYNPDAWGLPGPAPRAAADAAKAVDDVKPAELLAEAPAQFEDIKPAELIQPLETPKTVATAAPAKPAAPKKPVARKAPRKKEISQKVKEAGKTQHREKVAPKQACPNKNWIDLNYKYVSERPVKNALFEVYAADTNQCVAKGALNDNGEAHVEGLPDWVSDVYFKYTSDPQPYKIFPKFKPIKNPLKKELVKPVPVQPAAEEGYGDKFMRYANQVMSTGMTLALAYNQTQAAVGQWAWGAVQGDWNDDQTLGQILADMVISLIPFVDQAADIRDITANLKKLIWDQKYDELGIWFSLVVTVIGCIPEAGTVIKGAVKSVVKVGKEVAQKVVGEIGQKLAKHGIDFSTLIKFLNHFGEGNAVKWMREQINNWGKHVDFVKGKIREIILALQLKCAELSDKLFAKGQEIVGEVINRAQKVVDRIDRFVGDIMEFAKKELDDLVKKAEDYKLPGKTQEVNGAKQISVEPPTDEIKPHSKPKKRPIPDGVKELAARAGMEPEELEGLIKHCNENGRRVVVRFTNPQALKWHKYEGYVPKPVAVKLKTDKGPQFGGLVVKPKGPRDKWAQWERDNVDYLESHGFRFDQDNVLRGPSGEKFYGDYDLQAVLLEVFDEASGKKVYMSELTNPEDTDVVAQINRDMGRPNRPVGQDSPIQHGAEHDYYVKPDANGKPFEDPNNYGKTTPATEEEIVSGNRVLGRQYGEDEKYLVVSADGKAEIMENPRELHDLYKRSGMPWDYHTPPPSPGVQKQIDADLAAEKAAKEAAEAEKAAKLEAERKSMSVGDLQDWIIDNVLN